jgi:hypothetical protein
MGNTDSQTKLRSSVQTFLGRDVNDSDTDLWCELFSLPSSYDEVITALSIEELRTLCADHPANLKGLVHKSILQLELLADKPELRSSELCRFTENAVKWLTRVLPFMLEPSVAHTFHEFWWEGMAPRLVSYVLRLLFCPGFSVPSSAPGLSSDSAQDLLWGSAVSLGSSNHWRVRTDLVKLLLCCLSQELQEDVQAFTDHENLWRVLICNKGLQGSSVLILSIISVLSIFDQRSRSWLPYNDSWSSSDLEDLVLVSLQYLNCCLINIPKESSTRPTCLQDAGPNLYTTTLQSLSDLSVLAAALHSNFRRVTDSANTYLPGSMRVPTFIEELLVFCFRCLQIRPDLASVLSADGKALDIAAALVHIVITYKDNLNHYGLLQQALFIMQALSTDREFSITLNTPFAMTLSIDLPVFSGTYADLLFLSYSSLMQAMPLHLLPLQPTLLVTLSNV